MEAKGNEPIFSRSGYSIWKNDSKEQPNQKKLNESKKPFVVKNCFGTEVGSFDSKEDARKFLDQKIQQGKAVGDILAKGAALSQIAIFFGLFLSFCIGYFTSLSYFKRYNEMWLFPEVVSGDSIKLLFIGFGLAIFLFYLPIFYGFFLGKQKIFKMTRTKYRLCNFVGIIIFFIISWFV